jgi:flagellar hook-basal body complex protein FliE
MSFSQLARISKARQQETKIKALLYGKAGTGKTTSVLASCERPVLVIDTEKGSSIYGGAFDFDLFESLDPLDILQLTEEMLQAVAQGQQLPWKTIVIDSGTVLYALIKQHALEKFRTVDKNPEKMKLDLDEWAYPKELLYKIINNLKKLPIHLYVTAHEAPNYLPNQIMKVDPTNPTRPDLEKRSEHEFDVIIHLEKKNGKHKATVKKSRLINSKGEQILPEVIDNVSNMDFAAMLHKLVREAKGIQKSAPTEPTNVIRTNAKFESMLDEALTNVQALQWSTDRLVALFKEYTGHDNPNTLRDDPDAEAKIARFLDMTRTELANASGGVVENIE